MLMLSRRQMVGSLLGAPALSLLAPAAARAESEFRLKCGLTVSAEHPLTKGVLRAADRVREDTKGRVDIQAFPSSQLGSQTDMISQLRSGALEMTPVSSAVLSSLYQPAGISGIAYAFDDYADAWRTMDGPLGASVRRGIERLNITAFDRVWDGGYFDVMSAPKPIRTPADLTGFKLRVPPTKLWISLYEAYGAGPVAISWGDVYTSLQTRIVDGVDSALVNFADSKLFEVQKYASLTRHVWDGFTLLANKRGFERMPADLQNTIKAAFDAEALVQRQEMVTLEKQIVADLQVRGMTVIEPDREQFREALKKTAYYPEWRKRFGDEAWTLLSQGAGKSM